MKQKVYAIVDKKVNAFNSPIVTANDDVMKRMVHDTIMQGDSLLAKYPSDFDLYDLGEFDNESGKFTNNDIPKLLCNLKALTAFEAKGENDE